ncbi:hypothetical protein EW146_g1142 [Bondarzewia mesenterica]|uniref:TFIID-31kDa-domain-containing protein n=1 Tax=Bondarzewia mesenterica TaxID=1095465 RepID=A0A4S4M4M2_9AGAM|nr:hypothetical protein EW146_g1142 [Bondarzewia mesenterica]
MSRNPSATADSLPPTARAIALLLASTPTVQDAQPGVLHQLLEFSHRYTSHVLSDALIYAEHAGHPNKIEMDDVVLSVQARVGWEFGGRVPQEYTLSLATQTNAQPLPAVPETFGLRLPPPNECLTAVDFDIIPNKPPPAVKQYDEEIEEVEESASEEDEDMELAPIPMPSQPPAPAPLAGPISAVHTPSDVDMVNMERVIAAVPNEVEEGSDEDDGLFAGGDDEESGADEPMEEVAVPAPGQTVTNGVKRKLVEEDDYD